MSSCFFVHRHLSWMSQCSFIPPLHCSKHCLSLWSTRRSWRPQRCTWKVNELCENTGCGMWCVIVTVPSRCWSRELFGVKFLLDWTVATAIKTRLTDWWFHMVKYLSSLSWTGVSAVEAEWVPQLLPQYCHFSSPQESPSPWFCSSTGTIRCHRASTFCEFCTVEHHLCVCAERCHCLHISNRCVFPAVRVAWQLPAVEMEYPDGLERYKLFSRFLLEGQVLQQNLP